MEKIQLMSHLVAGYPTDELAFTAARAMVEGGADILEVQLPFSDPSADGPAIQGACTEVLSRHYRTADGLAFIARLHQAFPGTLIYLMSYGSLICLQAMYSREKHRRRSLSRCLGSLCL